MSFESNDIKKIKDSFDALRSKTTPEFVWDKLDKQLYIERTWVKIKAKLDIIHAFRKRKPLYISMIFVILITCGIILLRSEFVKSWYGSSSPHVKRTRLLVSSSKNSSSQIFASPMVLTVSGDHLENSGSDLKKSLPVAYDGESEILQEKYVQENLTTSIPDENKILDEAHILNDELSMLPLKAILDFSESKNESGGLYFETRDSVYKINKKRKSLNEIGFIYALNNTLILNNHSRLSYQETSLIEGIPAITSNYGLIFNHQLNGNRVLSLEYLFTSKENQVVNIFINGKQYQKNLEIDYTRLSVLYQRNFYPGKPQFFSNYYIKAGLYFAYMKNILQFYRIGNDTINDFSYNYSKDDYGLKLGFGLEKNMNNFVFGFGFASEYGLKNIFLGDDFSPASFDPTNIHNNGLNISIRYKLN